MKNKVKLIVACSLVLLMVGIPTVVFSAISNRVIWIDGELHSHEEGNLPDGFVIYEQLIIDFSDFDETTCDYVLNKFIEQYLLGIGVVDPYAKRISNSPSCRNPLCTIHGTELETVQNADMELQYADLQLFVDDNEFALYLSSHFDAITHDQHDAFSQIRYLSDEDVMEIMGVNRHKLTYSIHERGFLKALADKEVDLLLKPFREIIHAINVRYGTNMEMPYLYKMELWENPDSFRETSIRILSGETSFDEWFSAVRESVNIPMQQMIRNAHAAMVVDGRLSADE